MGMEVLEVNTPGELVMWLYLAESEVSMEQGEAEIILDYLKEHNMALAVCSRELMVRDMGEEPSEYQPYSIDDAIHDVCEWNLELIDEMEEGMKNPDSREDYDRFSDALDVLKQQEEVLDGLYSQTKYEQIAVECALQAIIAALGSVPEGVQEKLDAYRQRSPGQTEKTAGMEEGNRQETGQQERIR